MRFLIVGTCVVTAVGAVYLLNNWEKSQPVASSATTPEPVVVATAKPPSPPPGPLVIRQAPAVAVPPPKASKSAEYERLVATGKPSDAFQAYVLAHYCQANWDTYNRVKAARIDDLDPGMREALEDGSLKQAAKEQCGDITAAQLAGRIKQIEIAAEAGVPMAAVYLAAEPPFADSSILVARPDDPQVRAWEARMTDLMKLAASKGDTTALTTLSEMYATGSGVVGQRDPVLALQYAVALRDTYTSKTGRQLPYGDQRLQELSQGLTPEQVALATEAGHQFARGSKQ